MLLNRWRDWRPQRAIHVAGPDLASIESLEPGPDEELAEADYRRYLVGWAMHLMKADFQPATWQACWETVPNDRRAAEVAAQLGMSPAAVYAATARVLKRLRSELDGFLELTSHFRVRSAAFGPYTDEGGQKAIQWPVASQRNPCREPSMPCSVAAPGIPPGAVQCARSSNGSKRTSNIAPPPHGNLVHDSARDAAAFRPRPRCPF